MAIKDGALLRVERRTPGLGAMQVLEDLERLLQVRGSGLRRPRGQVDHFFADVVTALEAIDEGTNNALEMDGVLEDTVTLCSAQRREM